MSLHLLHHKSWHVWNKDNIEKVRRDEQKFKEEEEKKHQKQLAIEREKRYTVLKERVKNKRPNEDADSLETGSTDQTETTEEQPQDEPILKRRRGGEEVNKDNLIALFGTSPPEVVEQPEKKTMVPNNGLQQPNFTFGTVDEKSQAVWYASNKARPQKNAVDQAKMEKRKQHDDPLSKMSKYIDETKSKHKEEKKKKEKKDKSQSGKKSIEDLRRERLERERKEAEKASKIIFGNSHQLGKHH